MCWQAVSHKNIILIKNIKGVWNDNNLFRNIPFAYSHIDEVGICGTYTHINVCSDGSTHEMHELPNVYAIRDLKVNSIGKARFERYCHQYCSMRKHVQ